MKGAAVLVGAAVLLAGCGGSSSPTRSAAAPATVSAPAPVTRAAFIDAGDRVCGHANHAAHAMNTRLQAAAKNANGDAETMAAILPVLRAGLAQQRGWDDRFAALTPPPEDRGRFHHMITMLHDRTGLLADATDAARRGDAAQFITITDDLDREKQQARAYMQGYGFHACGSTSADTP